MVLDRIDANGLGTRVRARNEILRTVWQVTITRWRKGREDKEEPQLLLQLNSGGDAWAGLSKVEEELQQRGNGCCSPFTDVALLSACARLTGYPTLMQPIVSAQVHHSGLMHRLFRLTSLLLFLFPATWAVTWASRPRESTPSTLRLCSSLNRQTCFSRSTAMLVLVEIDA